MAGDGRDLVCDLVLEGGGVKGNALIGAAAAFEAAGYRFHRIAGTSAGAIIASLLGAGLPAARLHELMLALDYREFLDPTRLRGMHLGRLGSALAELVDEGLYRGDALAQLVGGWLAEAGVRTFADLRLDDPGADPNLPAEWRFRVVMIVSDITRQTMVRVPWDLRAGYGIDPAGFAVAEAVHMSAAIPFFYVPVRLRSELTGQVSEIVDGALTSSFPVHIFDRTDGRPPRWPTFHVALASARAPGERMPELSGRLDAVRAMVNTALHGRINAERGDISILRRTIPIDTSYVATTDFAIDAAARRRLYDDGFAAARRFLDGMPAGPAPEPTGGGDPER